MRFAFTAPCVILLLWVSTPAVASPWIVDKDASKIEYTYNWSGAEAGGDFGSFDAEIDFAKDDLANSKVRVVIDMSSVSAAYSQVPAELVKPDWFDVDQFPKAIFESTSFQESDDGSYVASGTLTLKGITQPSVLRFQFESYGPVPGRPNSLQAVMTGATTISRTSHNVGQGSWSATDTLADDVTVMVNITADQTTTP